MRFLERLARRRSSRHVILYGKPGCHLCDDVHDLLIVLGQRYPLELQEVDIRSDPELFRRYDIRIPVLVIDGVRELEAPITGQDLQRALRMRRPGDPPSKSR